MLLPKTGTLYRANSHCFINEAEPTIVMVCDVEIEHITMYDIAHITMYDFTENNKFTIPYDIEWFNEHFIKI